MWFMTDIFITGAPCRWSTAKELDTENITVWSSFTLEPDIMTGVTGFTKKVMRLQHFILRYV
jgi:hypothetical protein